MKKSIYVLLQGRIGNQLFIYAFAKAIALQYNEEVDIIIDDSEVLNCNWENSLEFYNLKNVTYIHKNELNKQKGFKKQYYLRKLFRIISKNKSYNDKFYIEKKYQSFLNKNGLIMCENGYLNTKINTAKNQYIEGFFQSEKYFEKIREIILKDLNPSQFIEVESYPNIDKIRTRNTVCTSIKVEHNIGSELYDVCTKEYWKKAIKYIEDHVENPLFFICSDNVDYVINHLIDTQKYDYICQDPSYPTYISLSVMSECKHFIIGNTTFGWWAQYLSNYKEKIVIAPSQWMKVDMPIDIYQDNWTCIDV